MNQSSITPKELQQALGADHPPELIDVRRAAVFERATALIAGATWPDPASVDGWGTTLPHSSAVIVHCVHSHEVSQNCANQLRSQGVNVRFPEGGIEAWRLADQELVTKEAPQN
jgi:rhodanese-related sulfurtransferase